mmetsp:Transcript_753/g.2166  ORF Transcript_753/g.2166 Transcript_753/m.2166 type:complete len:218 (-) Transcript_753:628-1281(-)
MQIARNGGIGPCVAIANLCKRIVVADLIVHSIGQTEFGIVGILADISISTLSNFENCRRTISQGRNKVVQVCQSTGFTTYAIAQIKTRVLNTVRPFWSILADFTLLAQDSRLGLIGRIFGQFTSDWLIIVVFRIVCKGDERAQFSNMISTQLFRGVVSVPAELASSLGLQITIRIRKEEELLCGTTDFLLQSSIGEVEVEFLGHVNRLTVIIIYMTA